MRLSKEEIKKLNEEIYNLEIHQWERVKILRERGYSYQNIATIMQISNKSVWLHLVSHNLCDYQS